MFKAAPGESGSGGSYLHVLPNRGPRIYGLGMLLLDSVDLTSLEPKANHPNPSGLQGATRSIGMAGAAPTSTLEGQMLLSSRSTPGILRA